MSINVEDMRLEVLSKEKSDSPITWKQNFEKRREYYLKHKELLI